MTPSVRSALLAVLTVLVSLGWISQEVADLIATHAVAILTSTFAIWSYVAAKRAREEKAKAKESGA